MSAKQKQVALSVRIALAIAKVLMPGAIAFGAVVAILVFQFVPNLVVAIIAAVIAGILTVPMVILLGLYAMNRLLLIESDNELKSRE